MVVTGKLLGVFISEKLLLEPQQMIETLYSCGLEDKRQKSDLCFSSGMSFFVCYIFFNFLDDIFISCYSIVIMHLSVMVCILPQNVGTLSLGPTIISSSSCFTLSFIIMSGTHCESLV